MVGEFDDAIVVVGVPGLNGGGITAGDLSTGLATKAPVGATYITQTADATLTAEQALSSLATGLVKVTTGTGALSTATGSDVPSHSHTGVVYSIQFVIDGNGSAITTGVKYDSGIQVPVVSTITGWDLRASTNSNIVLTVQRVIAAGTSWTDISGTDKPTLSAQTFYPGTGLVTSWTTSMAVNDYLRVSVDSATSTFATLTIFLTRSI